MLNAVGDKTEARRGDVSIQSRDRDVETDSHHRKSLDVAASDVREKCKRHYLQLTDD